ncbi:MAG: hypothetical protein GY862_13270 [Gammaproteobacteria bacterium]|nr:hypothetical protein [Gammaproteobacteria bacterium]
MLKSAILVTLLWALSLSVSAAVYYLSNQGNDANDGLSPQTAWQTLEQANNAALADGDSILLQRGHVFRGELNPRKTYTHLTYGAYGQGARPVIAGSIAIANWQPSALGAGIYQANVAGLLPADSEIQHLFANGKLQTIARFPNVDSPAEKNWLKVGGEGTDGFTDPVLAASGKPDGYWTGATLRIRDYSWTFEVRPVTGYSAATGRLSIAGLGKQLPEWGYFLDGKLEELDHPGEWFYQAETQTVFFYPPAGQNPNQMLIEGSVYGTGLSINNHDDYATAQDLIFRHFSQEGVHLNSSAHVTVQNCHFEHNTVGLSSWNINAAQIINNTFNKQFKNSINLNASSDFDVEGTTAAGNVVLNSAMYPVYGIHKEGVYNGIGINVFGQNHIVRDNWVKNTAWVGINVQGNGAHVIQGNIVMDTLLLLNDGGSVIVMSSDNTITDNILLNAWGNTDESNGCASTSKTPCSKHSSYGMGIGSNPEFNNVRIENNIIAFNRDTGIRLNSFSNATVTGNTVFDSDPGIVVQDKNGPSANNLVTGNRIFSLHPDRLALSLTNAAEHGIFDANFYCNPYSELLIQRDGQHYSLGHWQQRFAPLGGHSTSCGWIFPEYTYTQKGGNLIANGDFSIDISGWSPTADPQRLFLETARAEMDGNSLRVQYPGDGKALNVSAGSFTVQQGQWYRLAFSLMADGYGDIRLRGNRTKPEYVILHERNFALTPGRRDYEWFYQSPESTEFFKYLFATDEADTPTYWLDNVSLAPVQPGPVHPHSLTRLWLNLGDTERTFALGKTQYTDANAQAFTGQLALPARSAKVLAYAGGALPPPATPSLKLIQAEHNITLAWNKIPDADGYRLYYAPYPNAEAIAHVDLGNITQFSADLGPAMAFYIAITALNPQGESDYSNVVWFILS